MPSTEEEGEKEEEEEEGVANNGEANHATSIQATENCRHKRSFRHGFSRFVATKRRKMKMKSEPVSDSVSSRSQISCCLLPTCFTGPQSLTPDSPLSAPAFQSLIEKNDFYSTECNVHEI